jgi:molybdenum cofactor cytidylyltransferase
MLKMSDSNEQKVALLLMAAGSSSRLGQPKQLVEMLNTNGKRQSLLKRQVSLMNDICLSNNAKAFCVLGFNSELMINHLANFSSAEQLTIIDNENWLQGLSSSIATGVSALGNDVGAVLIFLVDQWQLIAEDLISLMDSWKQRPEEIQIASEHHSISPPVIFPRSYFKELTQLSGDFGAKKVIKQNMKQVRLNEMPSAFFDLDTPEQLKELFKTR